MAKGWLGYDHGGAEDLVLSRQLTLEHSFSWVEELMGDGRCSTERQRVI
jgi:hypothetical protein